jgi:hypothetical protein
MAAEEKRGSAPTGMIWLNLTGDLPLFRRNGKHTGVRVSASAEGPDVRIKNETAYARFSGVVGVGLPCSLLMFVLRG